MVIIGLVLIVAGFFGLKRIAKTPGGAFFSLIIIFFGLITIIAGSVIGLGR